MKGLPFLKKDCQKQAKFLTLNISYDAIQCLAFYKEDGTTKIIGSGIEYLEPGSVRNGVIVDMAHVITQTESAISKATQHSEDTISNIIVGATSDTCQETVTTAKLTRASEEPITQKEYDAFEKRILDAAYLQIQQKFSEETGNTEEDFQTVTSSVAYMKLDNQNTEVLVNKEGKEAEVALYTAHCPTYYVKAIKKLTKSLKLNLLAISPENFAILKALEPTELESSDLVIIHVGSDFTNIGIVFGGAIVANKSLPIGKKHFTEEVSRIMGLTIEEASKVVDSHARGELSASESAIVQNCLSDVLDVWLEGISLLFSDFSCVKTFAPHIHLLGVGTKLPEIEETLTKNPWAKAIPFKAPPNIHLLKIEDLHKMVDATGAIISEDWFVPISLAYIYKELV